MCHGDSSVAMQLTSLLEQKKGFTYECFHGPARTSGLAESHPAGSEDDDMSGVCMRETEWACVHVCCVCECVCVCVCAKNSNNSVCAHRAPSLQRESVRVRVCIVMCVYLHCPKFINSIYADPAPSVTDVM